MREGQDAKDPPRAQVLQFWQTSFYLRDWPAHEAEAPGILEFLYAERARQAGRIASGIAPMAKSGLDESDFDLFEREHPGLQRLVAFIRAALQSAIAHVNGAKHPAERIAVTFADSWFHITEDGGFHDTHGHGGCSWCGIYYLQIGESGVRLGEAPNGLNRFYSPFTSGGVWRDYGNAYLEQSYLDPPARDGMLLLFPSYLQHSALPYRGSTDRVIVSFNARASLR